MSEKTKKSRRRITDIFKQHATTTGLTAGVHEGVRLVHIDIEPQKDKNNNPLKKQLFLKFKKFNSKGEDIGEKLISFFLVDPVKNSAVGNLFSFIAQTREILSIYCSEEEINESFDPISVLFDPEVDTREEIEVIEDYKYDVIKKTVLKKSKDFKAVETAVKEQFKALLEGKYGFDSKSFRLKLELSQKGDYIQIPRFDRFIEKSSVKKEESMLYINDTK